MDYIELHAHMVSRTTDDYRMLALTGCRVLTEPAFWAGYDRGSAAAFKDYFTRMTTFEPARAAEYDIQYFCWLCLNPKEAEDPVLTSAVLELIPEYLESPRVIGIGEIGLNRVTRNEMQAFEAHLDLAEAFDQLILIHTPHLEDKYKGTWAIINSLQKRHKLNPDRVLVDHAEEHTIEMILEAGYRAGLTLYPKTKVSPSRAIKMIEKFGADRICVSSACDWGPSTPLAIPDLILDMRRRGFADELIAKIVFDNPRTFLSASPKFSELLLDAA
jgi:uncharacterized protein